VEAEQNPPHRDQYDASKMPVSGDQKSPEKSAIFEQLGTRIMGGIEKSSD
jgi:hypothetical protein